jgi:RimJ/RimL family protein N-acetyltransferase
MTHREDFYTTQAELEGLRFDKSGHLERFKDMPGESGPPPRVVAVNHRGRTRIYCAAGVDPQAAACIRRLSFDEVWTGDPRLREALCRTTHNQSRTEYSTYTPSRDVPMKVDCLAQKLSSSDERLRGFSDGFFGIGYPDVFVVLAEGKVVAAAASSREDERSAEAWVYVSTDHRRRGLAGHVVRAWVRCAEERGLLPFYTHAAENVPSRRLAESLRLSLRFRLACYA